MDHRNIAEELETKLASLRLTGKPVLYSTNTWLAYNISEDYYGGQHYVWCTPFFQVETFKGIRYQVAPTSNPKKIYEQLYDESHGDDLNSSKIRDNRAGILNGAAIKREAGVITAEEEGEIADAVERAAPIRFRPLLYIIPCHLVAGLVRRATKADRPANPLSKEYIIEALPNDCFDVIEFSWK
jgi:hypothetical protein